MKEEIRNGAFAMKSSGAEEKFSTGAVRDVSSGKGRFDLIPLYPMVRLAKVFEAGGIRYQDRNWERGMPLSRLWNSALRHLLKYAIGLTDEDHHAQGIWNLWNMMHTKAMIDAGALPKELDDFPFPEHKALAEMVLKLLEPTPQ